MALSNWDLLAIGNDGKNCDGIVNGKIASLEIYKDWAHIISKKMWIPDSDYTNDVIAIVNSGNINIGGLDIYAIRHDLQSSIFVFVDASYFGKNNHMYTNYFAGIGCYAYYTKIDEFLKWKNIDIKYDECTHGSRNYSKKTGEHSKFVDYIQLFDKDNLLLETEVDEEFGELTDFVGVMPQTFEAFKNWLTTEIAYEFRYDSKFSTWLNKINWNEITRYNQGDTIFVGSKNASTTVGNQNNDTLLSNMFKK